MNESNESIEEKKSMYTSPEATIIFVTLFWTIVTVSSWIIRSALLWLLDTSFTQQPKQNMINSNAKSKLFVTFPSLNNFRNLIRDKFSSTPQLVIMLVDAIATIEICACSLELWPIREVFGYWGLMIAIMLNGIRSNLFISLDAFGSPCNPWYRFLLGRTQLIWMASTWVIQLLSASIALEICKFWWSLKITVYHSARYELALKMLDPKNLINYTPDLNVTVWIGFLCEAIGTFLDFYLVTLFSCALKYWNSRSIKYDSDTLTTTNVNGAIINSQVSYSCSLTRKQFLTSFILRTMISFILTAYGLGWTGMYLNPANAFIQCWRIGSISPISHIIVYWLGPIFGIWLCVIVEKWTYKFLSKTRSEVSSIDYKVDNNNCTNGNHYTTITEPMKMSSKLNSKSQDKINISVNFIKNHDETFCSHRFNRMPSESLKVT